MRLWAKMQSERLRQIMKVIGIKASSVPIIRDADILWIAERLRQLRVVRNKRS
jgi:hypothetical protein